MISLKKQLVKNELDALFHEHPILIWYQTKQKSTKEWTQLKKKVKSISQPNDASLRIVQTKTSILKFILKSKVNNPVWLQACQGQLLVCGCHTSADLKNLLSLLNNEKDGFVVGGFYGNMPRTFLEIEKLQLLGTQTYAQLIQSLQSVLVRFLLLKRICDFSYLRRLDMTLCHTIKQCGQKDDKPN